MYTIFPTYAYVSYISTIIVRPQLPSSKDPRTRARKPSALGIRAVHHNIIGALRVFAVDDIILPFRAAGTLKYYVILYYVGNYITVVLALTMSAASDNICIPCHQCISVWSTTHKNAASLSRNRLFSSLNLANLFKSPPTRRRFYLTNIVRKSPLPALFPSIGFTHNLDNFLSPKGFQCPAGVQQVHTITYCISYFWNIKRLVSHNNSYFYSGKTHSGY